MDPQPCSKCSSLPEDILMLSCSHDLCLNCAAERLSFELKKKNPAKSITCEFCYQRTPLDSESISQLEKLLPSQRSKPYTPSERAAAKYDRVHQKIPHVSDYDPRERPYDRKDYMVSTDVKTTSMLPHISISNKKICSEHTDEEILYFCFDCKCECICPECIIHGKHKDHEVKTLKKSYPTVKSQLQSHLDRIQSVIETLLIRKSEAEKGIRILSEQNVTGKRQIQQAFDEVRTKLDQQEKQILHRCDAAFEEARQEVERVSQLVVKRIEELKLCSAQTSQYIKKDELTMLNFYAKKWRQLKEQVTDAGIVVNPATLPSNQKILASIISLTDQIGRINQKKQ